ncbi:uncharacterized protein LOC127869047 [Dreissena polymorpha]|uniref:Uncharacterized protein n=1 Tax=Dreissena polymorpha TaxID=45954 RepID=A0A9D4RM95_DREPO|nr:uncharacterized protein LOC127869047 [Dreissena polymorpha]KAH3873614.1 hypothetical protein DPMN_036852 [Dreissena polymorpha]
MTVYKCAVSPSGDRIFVTKPMHAMVLTLARDGTVFQTFTNPDHRTPSVIHVTDVGQVLVCGGDSFTILQLVGEGKKSLATLANWSDGLEEPESVCYNRSTASIIVGQDKDYNNVLVFKVK